MATRQKYNLERIKAIANESAKTVQGSLGDGIARISCEYLRTENPEACHADGTPKRGAQLIFRWCVEAFGFKEDAYTMVRCNHALERGVGLPDAWDGALRSFGLNDIAEKCAKDIAEEDEEMRDVRCTLVGQATPPTDPRVGKAVALCDGGDREVYLRMAQIANDNWLVHKGIDGTLCAHNPLAAEGLVARNITTEGWGDRGLKRLRPAPHTTKLRSIAQTGGILWDTATSIAHYCAEEARAAMLGKPLDATIGLQRFVRNPFRWKNEAGWHSQLEINFLWSWQKGNEIRRHAFVQQRLDSVLTRKAITIPKGLSTRDAEMLRLLLQAADIERKLSKVPCNYLGAWIDGKFEEDPAMWPSDAYADDRKSHATVFYEWPHVQAHSTVHRVSYSAHHLTADGRRVPLNPLRSTQSQLIFSLAWMQEVAQNVHPDIEYIGLAFDLDRADFQLQLPHEGVDIQNSPVYWRLPDGRAVQCSVKQLTEKAADELIDPHAHELYEEVGKQIGQHPLGTLPDEVVDAFRDNAGTLAERLDKRLDWKLPESETDSCWYCYSASWKPFCGQPILLC